MSRRSSSSSSTAFVLSCCVLLSVVTGTQQSRSGADGDAVSIDRRDSGPYGDKCSQTSQAVVGQCDFVFNATARTLQATGLCNKNGPQRSCQSCPGNGGVGGVTRVEAVSTVSGETISDPLCSDCKSGEVLDNDVTFCSNQASSNNKCNNPFGHCPGVNVYRCSCEPTTTTNALHPYS